MNHKLLILAVSAFALSGCIAQSRIQAKYMDQEATCRSEAAGHVNDTPPVPEQPGQVVHNDNTTAVFAAFSACMNKAGWKVSVPKTQTAGGGTTLPPSGSPGPGGTVARTASSQPTTAAPIIGPGVQPSPATSSTVPRPAAARPAAPAQAPTPAVARPQPAPVAAAPEEIAPATYQPAGRPSGAAAPSYGSGAGRNF